MILNGCAGLRCPLLPKGFGGYGGWGLYPMVVLLCSLVDNSIVHLCLCGTGSLQVLKSGETVCIPQLSSLKAHLNQPQTTSGKVCGEDACMGGKIITQ